VEKIGPYLGQYEKILMKTMVVAANPSEPSPGLRTGYAEVLIPFYQRQHFEITNRCHEGTRVYVTRDVSLLETSVSMTRYRAAETEIFWRSKRGCALHRAPHPYCDLLILM
jgi:hypothetical protein